MLKCDDRKTCINVDILYRDMEMKPLERMSTSICQVVINLCAGERKAHQGEAVKARCKEVWQCEEWEEKISARMWEQCGEDKEGSGERTYETDGRGSPWGVVASLQSWDVLLWQPPSSSPASSALRSASWLSASFHPLHRTALGSPL